MPVPVLVPAPAAGSRRSTSTFQPCEKACIAKKISSARVTVGLPDVSAYPALFAELLARGWTEADCAALAGGNLLRALREAESFAART